MVHFRLDFRVAKGVDYEEWYFSSFNASDFDDESDEERVKLLGKILVLRDPHGMTSKVRVYVHDSNDRLDKYEHVARELCANLGVDDAEVTIIKCIPGVICFNLREPEEEDLVMENDAESESEGVA